MPDIMIRGMEMPKTCSQCPLCYDYMECKLLHFAFWNTNESFDCCEDRIAGCPLFELPPHGDLIDLDAKVDCQYYDEGHEEWSIETVTVEQVLHGCLEKMPPVIVPANKEGKK